jgi:AcrR family transcriptional regulator
MRRTRLRRPDTLAQIPARCNNDGDLLHDPTTAADPYLDAFARLVEQRGLERTRVRDVADEVGVNRVTVYRQVGTVRDMTQLLFERELRRSLPDVTGWATADDAIGALVALLADVVRVFRAHPVLTKVLEDEPHLLGPYLLRDLPEVLGRSAHVSEGLLTWAMERGRIARRDPARVGDWVARVLVTAVLSPPAGDLEAFFDAGLRPLLEVRDGSSS